MVLLKVPEKPSIVHVEIGQMTLALTWNTSLTVTVNKTYINYANTLSADWMSVTPSDEKALSYTLTDLSSGTNYEVCIIIQSYDKNSTAACVNVSTSL